MLVKLWILRMTKTPNPGFIYFCEVGGEEVCVGWGGGEV